MLLSDGEIRELIEQDVLVNADKNNVGTITCDLRTKRFVFSDGPSRASCSTVTLRSWNVLRACNFPTP